MAPPRTFDDHLLTGLQPPVPLKRLATTMLFLLALLPILLLVTPWQQAALGSGRVIALAPVDRQQVVDARIDARIRTWHVQEGERVAADQLLVTLADNDPEYLARLKAQQTAAEQAAAAAQAQIDSYTAKQAAAEAQVGLVVAEYDRKIAALKRKRVGLESEQVAEERELTRQQTLAGEGISSQRKLDLARMKRDKADAALQAMDQEIQATRQARDKARAEAEAKAAAAAAELQAARVKLAEAEQKLVDTQVKQAQQGDLEVRAPQDGTVLAVYGGPGTWVKKGDSLVSLVPQTTSRAVELKIDGNDAPLVKPGESVRLVFEGWPALQFVGLRGMSSPGTFGGEVALVDAADDGSGKFRIVVVPADDEVGWPDADVLRQGTRAKGWVLLGQVSLGYELWRQINGFPALPPADKGSKPSLPSNKKPRAPAALD